jgi:hypothetical protein
MEDGNVDSRFTPSDSVLSVDDATGDAIVYSGGGAASFYRGTWHPGQVFHPASLLSRDSGFSAVEDPGVVQRYLDAAHDALVRSLET